MRSITSACDMTALSAEQRAAHVPVAGALPGAVEGVEESPDGYALRISAGLHLLRAAAAFISSSLPPELGTSGS